MTNTTKTAKITNRDIDEYIAERRPFEANSTSGKWEGYRPYQGQLPSVWFEELTKLYIGGAVEPVFVVKSYSTPIAWWTETAGWVIPDVRYSVTTSKAQSYVRLGARHGGSEFRSEVAV